MSNADSTRRRLGRLVAVVLVAAPLVLVAAPLVLAGRASAQHGGGHGGHGDGLIPEGDWTEEQIEYMLDLIDETERVLPERFPTVATYDELEEVLGGMGFFEFGATAPGGYDHWINPEWVADDTVVDPEFSESLVYQYREDDGMWELVSAMFMLHPEIGMDEIPEEIAFLPGWHGHPELCVSPDGTFAGITDPEDPDCPEGTSQATTPLMMHVWLFDPGCGHRFGGIGVGGLHCEHGGHGGGTTSTTHGHTSTTTATTARPTSTTSPAGPPSPAPPSQPVGGRPNFFG